MGIDKVLFQVTVPDKFKIGTDVHESDFDLSSRTKDNLKRAGAIRDILKEEMSAEELAFDQQLLFPPLIVRVFLKNRGVNDASEHSVCLSMDKGKTLALTASGNEMDQDSQIETPPDEKVYTFTFTAKASDAEAYADRLKDLGVGSPDGYGTLNVIPLQLSRISTAFLSNEEKEKLLKEKQKDEESEQNTRSMPPLPSLPTPDTVETHMKSKIDEFKKTIKSRIAIDEAITIISGSSEFNFDYIMLVFSASVLAAVGLSSNSQVTVVASMLVSPIMGPVLGVTFGTLIRDWKLVKKGLIAEMFAQLLCLFVGFCHGIIVAVFQFGHTVQVNEEGLITEFWPAAEMRSRATWSAIVSGCWVAFFSGIAVALAVLGNNGTGLVGVAISASLLPPIVNSGLLLAYAVMLPTCIRVFDINQTLHENPNHVSYFEMDVDELLRMSGMSFLLATVNIILIFVSAYLMFKVKEVAPLKNKSDFWATHIQETRKFNQIANTPGDESSNELLNAVKAEIAEENLNEPAYVKLTNGFNDLFLTTKKVFYLGGDAKAKGKKVASNSGPPSSDLDTPQVDIPIYVNVDTAHGKETSEHPRPSPHNWETSKRNLNRALKQMASQKFRVDKHDT